MPARRIGTMPMTPAERQARHRAKQRRADPAHAAPPAPRVLPRPQRWAVAVATLVALQDEYRAWLERLPESLEGSPTAEKLQAITLMDMDFVISRPLVRPEMPLIRFLFVRSRFCSALPSNATSR